MRRTNAEIQEQAAEAHPILGDLSQLEWDGNRLRCPACGCLRASLFLVRHAAGTEPVCPTCCKAHRWAASQNGATGTAKPRVKRAHSTPPLAHRSQEPTAS